MNDELKDECVLCGNHTDSNKKAAVTVLLPDNTEFGLEGCLCEACLNRLKNRLDKILKG